MDQAVENKKSKSDFCLTFIPFSKRPIILILPKQINNKHEKKYRVIILKCKKNLFNGNKNV
ncbi:hypothetical protein NCCP28_30990 [Niallia sp. NCCP-28]|nr:hypothetical protein NCCP28_30990 [Niallia sp. NCCP-28]